ncbi:MAG: hypothetical protein ACLQVD_12060 [Capsulimonadaceae bacterium]
MHLDKLTTLKMKVIAENNFDPIWSYFMDEFAENDEFLKRGGPLRDANHPIHKLVASTAATVIELNGLKKRGKQVAGGVMPVYIPEDRFIHGGMLLHGYLVIFFYFEDIEVGMLMLDSRDGYTRMARLTVRPDNKSTAPA